MVFLCFMCHPGKCLSSIIPVNTWSTSRGISAASTIISITWMLARRTHALSSRSRHSTVATNSSRRLGTAGASPRAACTRGTHPTTRECRSTYGYVRVDISTLLDLGAWQSLRERVVFVA